MPRVWVLIVLGERYSSLAISRGVRARRQQPQHRHLSTGELFDQLGRVAAQRRAGEPSADGVGLTLTGDVMDTGHQWFGDVEVVGGVVGSPVVEEELGHGEVGDRSFGMVGQRLGVGEPEGVDCRGHGVRGASGSAVDLGQV